jgi:hypothetical protein
MFMAHTCTNYNMYEMRGSKGSSTTEGYRMNEWFFSISIFVLYLHKFDLFLFLSKFQAFQSCTKPKEKNNGFLFYFFASLSRFSIIFPQFNFTLLAPRILIHVCLYLASHKWILSLFCLLFNSHDKEIKYKKYLYIFKHNTGWDFFSSSHLFMMMP